MTRRKTRSSKEIFKEVVNNVFIPVYHCCYRDIIQISENKYNTYSCKSNFYKKGGKGGLAGSYDSIYNFIFVYKYLSIHTKIWVLIHEYEHYLCHIANCDCFGDPAKEEYCANKRTLKECIENDYLLPLSDFVRFINICVYDSNKNYNIIAKKIKKLKNWKKGLNILKENNII